MDPGQVSSWHRELPGDRCTTSQHDGGIVTAQVAGTDIDACLDTAPKLGPLGQHLDQPPVQVPLLHLELRDPVAQQAARRIRALEHGDRVPRSGQLLRRGQAGWAGPDHGDLPAGRERSRRGSPRRHMGGRS